MDLPHEKQFHFRDGNSAASLNDLKAKIESMSYQEFYHHVNAQKNDFAAWIRHVLRDERLADDLQKVTSIVETVEIINDYLHPRPVTAPRIDMQSKIEQSVFTNPMPSSVVPPAIEDVPTISPAVPRSTEVADFTIIEENERMDGKVREELFGTPEQPTQTTSQPQQPAQPSRTLSNDDMTRMIVKDFMYGLVFGLVIGIILGRLISF
jgi:hypothetical protein